MKSIVKQQGETHSSPLVVVKFVARGRGVDKVWRRQLPSAEPVWDDCRFVLDPEATEYDWFAVHDDLPPWGTERFSLRTERLRCDPRNTMLFTLEPVSIKVYGSDYLAQFGRIITSQEPWAIRSHPNAVFAQPALCWYYALATTG